jgi:hypothetical protein
VVSGRPEPEWLAQIEDNVEALREAIAADQAELAQWRSFGPAAQLRALVATALAYGRNESGVTDQVMRAAARGYERAKR